MNYVKIAIILAATVFLTACGGNSVRFQKSPVDDIVKQYAAEQDFSVILYDMDYDEGVKQYKHQYQVLIPKNDTVIMKTTAWLVVPDYFFQKHVDDMGMEIVSKVNGKVNKTTAPAGYNHYVGNEKYGRWTQRNGGSFWEFYGKYAFMSSMFRMTSYPVSRGYYTDYRSNYYGSRSYYGPTRNGSNYYGTRSRYNSGRSSAWNNKPQTFKEKVRSRVSQSSRRASSTRINRSTSRSSSSSMRSRGGGFGK